MLSFLMLLMRKQQVERHAPCSENLMPMGGETLAPLMEGPTPEDFEDGCKKECSWRSLQHWIKEQLLSKTPSISRTPSMSRTPSTLSTKRSDVRLLLDVLGAPLAPIPAVDSLMRNPSIFEDSPIEISSAQYIMQQYIAATGGVKLLYPIKNSYAMGKVKMLAWDFETNSKLAKTHKLLKGAETGGFVLWQMIPDMWYVEIAAGESKLHAGSDGKLVWRHTPWLGSHAAKGPVRHLRRSLQGLDPRIVSRIFANAVCVGEKNTRGEDCFVLKVATDRPTLAARSDGPAKIIHHVLFGFFSQRTGLLVQIEDSHLTKIQSPTGDVVYWETIIESSIEDYRSVDGISIAHGGRSVVTLLRFEEVATGHTKVRLEETWTIEEVAFNVPGLSIDCFIAPSDLRMGTASDVGERFWNISGSSKAALKKPQQNLNGVQCRDQIVAVSM